MKCSGCWCFGDLLLSQVVLQDKVTEEERQLLRLLGDTQGGLVGKRPAGSPAESPTSKSSAQGGVHEARQQ